MKIVIINGSPRRHGATSKILRRMEEELLKKEDVEVDFVDVSKLKLNFCTGCERCYQTGVCVFDDDLEKLSVKLSEADGVIIGSPTYVSRVSAQVKLITDRCHFVLEQLLRGKHALSVITYENYGARSANKDLKELFILSGAQYTGKLISKVPFNESPFDDESFEVNLEKKVNKFYNDICKKIIYPLQVLKQFVVFNVGIKPYVTKNKVKYNGVIEKHLKKRGLL